MGERELLSALEPFGRAADMADERMMRRYLVADLPDDTTVFLNITLGDLRKARAALSLLRGDGK